MKTLKVRAIVEGMAKGPPLYSSDSIGFSSGSRSRKRDGF